MKTTQNPQYKTMINI